MGGSKKYDAETLNCALFEIASLFNKYNVENWFISYGTLLGITRNNSCIINDDDVDIMCDIKDKTTISDFLRLNGYDVSNKHDRFVRLRGPVDLYFADVGENGDFEDVWNGIIWKDCYDSKTLRLIAYDWRGTTLYLPKNHKDKLKCKYGDTWRTPQNYKGPKSVKLVI